MEREMRNFMFVVDFNTKGEEDEEINMSFPVFQDPDVTNQRMVNLNKKAKIDKENLYQKTNGQKSRRVALSSITNIQGSRIQPSRAAKGKQRAPQLLNDAKTKSTRYTKSKDCYNEALSSTNLQPTDSPMILSPIICNSNIEDKCNENCSIREINKNLDVEFDLTEYSEDIYNYLKNTELKFRSKPNYMRKQADINHSMRSILVDWLVEVSEEYKLFPQTLFLAVNYIDRFLSQMSVLRGKLQLVGAACMLVAAKFEEIYPPEVAEFVYITDDTYDAKQVLRMEHLILKTLSFNLSVPTTRDFLERYLLAAGAKPDSQFKYLSEYLCELSLVSSEMSIKFVPSMLAASAVFNSSLAVGNGLWTPTLEYYSGYSLADIKSCVLEIHSMHMAANKHAQQAVQQKYKSPKYGCVASIQPPTVPCI